MNQTVEMLNQAVELPADYPTWHRSADEEFVNAATHGFGLVAALVGALVMTADLLTHASAQLFVSCELYLFCLVAVYAMSTLSHSATSVRWKSRFRQLDQAFIYLLVVATYTPFSVAYLHGGGWRLLLVAMWAIALTGFVAKAVYAHRVEVVSVTSYLILAWMPIVAVPAIWRAAPLGAFEAIMAGSACYLLGTFFLVYDERVRHFHATWHLLVIAGSACHFLGLFLFVVRGAG